MSCTTHVSLLSWPAGLQTALNKAATPLFLFTIGLACVDQSVLYSDTVSKNSKPSGAFNLLMHTDLMTESSTLIDAQLQDADCQEDGREVFYVQPGSYAVF